jgi:hypothetical protein
LIDCHRPSLQVVPQWSYWWPAMACGT